MWWIRLKALIVKEFQIILRDRKTRVILIAPPVIQIFLFSFASTLEVSNISLGVLNNDRGVEATRLIESFRNSPYFTRLTYLESDGEVKDFIDHRRGAGVLHFGPEFSRDYRSGNGAFMQVLLDGSSTNSALIVNGYIQRIVNTFNGDAAATRLVVRHWYNPNLSYLYFTVPCLIANICMIMGIVIPALSVAREREFGTFDQTLVSPLTTPMIIIGKTVPSLVIGILQATGMIAIAILIFGVPFTGSWLLLYFGMVIFIASVIGVGLFISSLCKTQQQAILGAFVFAVPAVLISGYATPIENMPGWLQNISLANPVRYFMVLVKGVFLKDMSWGVAMASILPLAAITVITLSFAGWFFSRRLD